MSFRHRIVRMMPYLVWSLLKILQMFPMSQNQNHRLCHDLESWRDLAPALSLSSFLTPLAHTSLLLSTQAKHPPSSTLHVLPSVQITTVCFMTGLWSNLTSSEKPCPFILSEVADFNYCVYHIILLSLLVYFLAHSLSPTKKKAT
jgi:hypothetical protein